MKILASWVFQSPIHILIAIIIGGLWAAFFILRGLAVVKESDVFATASDWTLILCFSFPILVAFLNIWLDLTTL